MRKAISIGIGAVCLLGLFSLPATAQSRLCQSLEAQLRIVTTGNSQAGSRRFQQYDRAVQQQNLQIRKTERAWERNGCNIRTNGVCNRITSSLRNMMANLGKLKAERARLSGGGNGIRERNRILSELRRNGCEAGYDGQQAGSEAPPSRRRTILEQIFGGRTYSNDGAYGNYNSELNGRYGTYRTLCVRTCDGYYFPISFSTVENRFEQDLAQCQKICPGAEVELFFHPMPNGDAETSISYRSGEPYDKLPNAFAYRKAVNPDCSCRFDNSDFQQIAGAEPSFEDQIEAKAEKSRPQMAVPSPRADRGLSEAEAENMRGGLTIASIRRLLGGNEETVDGTGKTGKIRIVGPVYFPVQ